MLGAASAASLWLSGDGRYLVTASSSGTALIRDRFVNQTVSLSSSVVFYPVISANGRYLAVLSTADLDSEAHGAGTKVFIMPNPL